MIGRFACVWDWSLIVPQDVLFGNISCFAPDYVFQEMGLLPNRRQLKRQEEPKARRGVTHHQPSDVRRKPPQTRLTASRQHSGPVVVNPIASVSGAPLASARRESLGTSPRSVSAMVAILRMVLADRRRKRFRRTLRVMDLVGS